MTHLLNCIKIKPTYTFTIHRYRSLNVRKLSQLLDNQQASFEVLQKLGFRQDKNRLLFECDTSHTGNIILKIDLIFFELSPKISLKFKYFVKNIFATLENDTNDRVATVHDYRHNHNINNDHDSSVDEAGNESNIIIKPNSDDDNNIDNTICDAIDQLPDSLLDEMSTDINAYCTEDNCNDFQSLANFLRKKKVEYKRKSIKMYNQFVIDLMMGIYGNILKSMILPLAKTWPKGINTYKYVKEHFLKGWRLPKIVVEGILEIFVQSEINFSDVNDVFLCYKIILDNVASVQMIQVQEYLMTISGNVVRKYTSNDEILLSKRFIRNLQSIFYRYFCSCMHTVGIPRFIQQADQFAQKWINYESTREEECKLLFNTKTDWKCYQCNVMNKCTADQCVGCNKGINPLMIPKENKSNCFCVKKPFGLIRLNPNVCSICLSLSSCGSR